MQRRKLLTTDGQRLERNMIDVCDALSHSIKEIFKHGMIIYVFDVAFHYDKEIFSANEG